MGGWVGKTYQALDSNGLHVVGGVVQLLEDCLADAFLLWVRVGGWVGGLGRWRWVSGWVRLLHTMLTSSLMSLESSVHRSLVAMKRASC